MFFSDLLMHFFPSHQPAGLAKGSVDMGASTQNLDPEDGEEEKPGITWLK